MKFVSIGINAFITCGGTEGAEKVSFTAGYEPLRNSLINNNSV
jgi:hypothetical protein